MEESSAATRRVVRFSVFELDVRSGELRKAGLRLNLPDQPRQILVALLERPGELVTRDELRQRLWSSETFVDFEHGLNAAVKRLRDTLGDSAETPRLIETVPRRGYRFLLPVDSTDGRAAIATPSVVDSPVAPAADTRSWIRHLASRIEDHKVVAASVLALGVLAIGLARYRTINAVNYSSMPRQPPPQRNLIRITSDPGLQTDVTWSPDGRFVAYASDKAGNFDIWVQPVAGGDAVQVTKSADHDTEPDWSPDGSTIVFRSERDGGGLFAVPALGGPERRLTSFGERPTWSPDGSQILFATAADVDLGSRALYVVRLDGAPPARVLQNWMDDELQSRGAWAWHPDGRRVSMIGVTKTKGFGLYTIGLSGGPATYSKLPLQGPDDPSIGTFEWAPSGTALYFAGSVDFLTNVWKLTVNPDTLEPHGLERLTTGGGSDNRPAISPDGKRLAFTTAAETHRLWSFPLDASAARITGPGKPVTDATVAQYTSELAPDGHRLVWTQSGLGTRQWELWIGDLATGDKRLLARDQVFRACARWSPDGSMLVYGRIREATDELTVAIRRVDGGDEQLLSPPIHKPKWTVNVQPLAWSPDGQSVLVTSDLAMPERHALMLWPIAAAPHADTAARPLAFDPRSDLWQGSFSPNGRWLSFIAVQTDDLDGASVLCTIPSTGASPDQWTRLTDVHAWADKPRWSPDGKVLYFWLLRGSLVNVWALRFDDVHGRAIGPPFQVTHFDSPARHISAYLGGSEPSVSLTTLLLPMTDASGSIWMLDNVDR